VHSRFDPETTKRAASQIGALRLSGVRLTLAALRDAYVAVVLFLFPGVTLGGAV
jgi:hypothetical protein